MLSLLLAVMLAAFDNLDLGVPGPCDQIVGRRGYALGYSEKYEQPLWVSYRLTADEVTNTRPYEAGDFASEIWLLWAIPSLRSALKSASAFSAVMPSAEVVLENAPKKRRGIPRRFEGDPRAKPVPAGRASGCANMSPQLPAFNRGVWKRLEEHVRSLAVRHGPLVVVTGPIFYTNTLPRTIGASHVRVPDAFYKAVYAEATPTGMVGFILPHEGTDAALCAFVTNVDAIEAMTGLDFFSSVSDDVETNLEARIDASLLHDLHSP